VRSFGEALAQELRGSGVVVSVLCPGTTATNFFNVAGGALSAVQMRRMMTAEDVARIGCAALMRGRRVAVAGLVNRVLSFAATHIPHSMTLATTERMLAQD
jgi:hypothetical protein